MARNSSTIRNAFVAALLVAVALAAVPAAFAGKGGNGGGNATQSDPSGSLLLDPSAGVPHWGQQITFDVTSSARYDFVTVMCYQGSVWVYGNSQNVGFGSVSPQVFYLQSAAWTGGAADCTAKLWASTSSGTFVQTLATTGFHVDA